MTDKMVEAYLKALENEERAAATLEKYRRALLSFAAFLSGAAVTREMIRLWKDDLRARNYVPSTINTYLAALNGFSVSAAGRIAAHGFSRSSAACFATAGRS